MNKILSYFLSFIAMTMIMSSCSYKVYPLQELESRYEKRMETVQEMQAKSHIHIFHSEEEIPCDYKILSYVGYGPLITIPIIAPIRRQMLNKFYKKAVLKAEELGGNGIIIINISWFKIIYAENLDKIKVGETQIDPNRQGNTILDPFLDGSVLKLDKKKKANYVDGLRESIEESIKNCKTHDDVKEIAKKINALEEFYKAEGGKRRNQEVVDDYRDDLRDAENDIIKKERRAAKKAAAKTDGSNKDNLNNNTGTKDNSPEKEKERTKASEKRKGNFNDALYKRK